jgi:hypothetical protein
VFARTLEQRMTAVLAQLDSTGASMMTAANGGTMPTAAQVVADDEALLVRVRNEEVIDPATAGLGAKLREVEYLQHIRRPNDGMEDTVGFGTASGDSWLTIPDWQANTNYDGGTTTTVMHGGLIWMAPQDIKSPGRDTTTWNPDYWVQVPTRLTNAERAELAALNGGHYPKPLQILASPTLYGWLKGKRGKFNYDTAPFAARWAAGVRPDYLDARGWIVFQDNMTRDAPGAELPVHPIFPADLASITTPIDAEGYYNGPLT